MSFFGLDNTTAPRYRGKRFLAFLIDIAIVILLWFLFYKLTGKPDFYAVQGAMTAASALPGDQAALNEVFSKFDAAYIPALLIWFGYETLTTIVLGGRTIGKLVMKLRIVPLKHKRNVLLNALLLAVRSALKMLSLYILQGFPFVICCLTVFGNKEGRSGFDMFVKMQTIDCRYAGNTVNTGR